MSVPREWRTALVVCLAAGAVRLVIAALTPLFPDETYYWEWSRNLATGYFDHPPVIAWLIRAGTLVFGATPLGVRLGPVLAGTVGIIFVCATARRVYGDRAGLLAALMLAVMPLSAAGLVLATPDAPLLAAVAATLYCVVRALEIPRGSSAALAWWAAAGIALGVSVASKYTAVLVPIGIFIALLTRGDLRPRLAEPGPYVATLVGVLVFIPVVLWNARHEWVSFAFQLRHGLAAVGGSIVNRELDLLGGQAGLVTPILFVMAAIAVARAVRDRSVVRPVLAITAAVIFAFFVYSATKRRVEANWPALAYLPAVVLLAGYPGGRTWRRWLHGGIGLAGVLSLVAYVNAFTPILPVPARRDPAARASGWNDLGRVVNETYARRLPVSSSRTWVAADRYQDASELAFHLPDHPRTFSLNLLGRTNQYALWPSFPDVAQPRDAMILVLEDTPQMHPAVERLEPHFEIVQRGDSVALARNGDVIRMMRVWHLERWRGTWPEPEVRSRP